MNSFKQLYVFLPHIPLLLFLWMTNVWYKCANSFGYFPSTKQNYPEILHLPYAKV